MSNDANTKITHWRIDDEKKNLTPAIMWNVVNVTSIVIINSFNASTIT